MASIDYTTSREAGLQLRKQFTVKSGEILDLGEIRIQSPAIDDEAKRPNPTSVISPEIRDTMAGVWAVSGEGIYVNRGLSEKAPSMSHVATGSLVRQLGTLFEGGSVARLSDRQLIDLFITSATGPARPPSLRCAVGPWFWKSAGNSSATCTMPRMLSRPSSSSWGEGRLDP